jgi:hypothetical protein
VLPSPQLELDPVVLSYPLELIAPFEIVRISEVPGDGCVETAVHTAELTSARDVDFCHDSMVHLLVVECKVFTCGESNNVLRLLVEYLGVGHETFKYIGRCLPHR